MLIVLKSKLPGPYVGKPEYIDRAMGRSFLLPQAAQGGGRIAANGDENSMLGSMEKVYAPS